MSLGCFEGVIRSALTQTRNATASAFSDKVLKPADWSGGQTLVERPCAESGSSTGCSERGVPTVDEEREKRPRNHSEM